MAGLDMSTANKGSDGSRCQPNSLQNSKMMDTLLGKANTMLRTATLSREPTNLKTTTSDSNSQSKSSIPTTISILEREKTTMVKEEDDDEMNKFLLDIKKHKGVKIKEFTDSDFDTDLEDEPAVTNTPSRSDVKKLYLKTCAKLGIRAIPHVCCSLENGREVTVKNRCMNALDLLSLSNCLINNEHITKLVLDGNMIGDEGAECIAWLMTEHESNLDSVSLADNAIGSRGFVALGLMLKTNKVISHLNLSGNCGKDEHIRELSNALMVNHHITIMNLSHNQIGDIGATILAQAIAANDGLHSLDISWNKIRPSGAVAIFTSLQENIILKSLNISMNGLSTPGAVSIGDLLKHNDSLTYLNVSFSRMFDRGCAFIAKGLERNEKLHHLIMHDNPITASGALTLLTSLQSNKSTAIWKLDLHTVPVVEKCIEIANEINYTSGDFEFRHAGLVDSEVNILGTENKLDCRNPMAIVKNYVEEEGLRMIDFFKQMDKDKGGSISREEFIEGLAAAEIPLNGSQIDKLIEILDKDGDGEIDYGELVDGDRKYKRAQLSKRMKEMEIIKEHLSKAKVRLIKKVPERDPFA